jgi:hypothetical protein
MSQQHVQPLHLPPFPLLSSPRTIYLLDVRTKSMFVHDVLSVPGLVRHPRVHMLLDPPPRLHLHLRSIVAKRSGRRNILDVVQYVQCPDERVVPREYTDFRDRLLP